MSEEQYLYRVEQLPSGRWLALVSEDGGTTWHRYAYRSYMRRGDAVRIVNMERVSRGRGRWWNEKEQTLSTGEQARLQAWKDEHKDLIAAETAQAITGLDEQEQLRGEFAKWLIAHGKLTDQMRPEDYGLSQGELFVA